MKLDIFSFRLKSLNRQPVFIKTAVFFILISVAGITLTQNLIGAEYVPILVFGSQGSGNGQFASPWGLAVDSSGNIWVADTSNHRIQKFNSTSVYQSQFGSQGSGNGQFNAPYGIAIDSSGNIFVADTSNNRIQKFDNTGNYLSQFGNFGSGNGQFYQPCGVAVDSSGNIFVVDTQNNRIQKFDNTGNYISQFGTSGTDNGQFNTPSGIAIDSFGNILVTDTVNNRIQKFNNVGAYQSQFTGQFFTPVGIALDSTGNIFVVGNGNNRIVKFDSVGVYQTQFGSQGTGNGQFAFPCGLAVDSFGNIFVADTYNNRIQKWADPSITPISVAITSVSDVKATTAFAYGTASGDEIGDRGFFWWNDTQYWGYNASGLISAGSGAGDFGIMLTDLPMQTQLYVSAYIKASGQIISSDNKISITTRAPMIPIVITKQEFTVEGNSVLAKGEITDVGSSSVTIYGFVYAKHSQPTVWDEPALPFVWDLNLPISQGKAFEGTIENLSAGTYYFRAYAHNSQGTSYGEELSFTIVSTDNYTVSGYIKDSSGNPGIGVTLTFSNGGGTVITDSSGFYTKTVSSDWNGTVTPSKGSYKFNPASRSYSNMTSDMSDQNYTFVASNKAIIVAGGGNYSTNKVWNATKKNADLAYQALNFQGYTDENIYYLSADRNFTNPADGFASKQNLQYAITTWASDADDLLIYMVDHGGNGTFLLNENEVLSIAGELDGWLDSLQQIIPGEVILIYDACESGSLIGLLNPPSGKKRIVAVSSAADEAAVFASEGIVSFSWYFWSQVRSGFQFYESFVNAKDAMELNYPQHSVIDTDGNGNGNEKADTELAVNVRFGNETASGADFPNIGSVSAFPQTLTTTTSALISAENVTDADGIRKVWAAITPPKPVSCSSPDIPVTSLPLTELMPVSGSNRYEAAYNGFTAKGTYKIAVFATDTKDFTSIPDLQKHIAYVAQTQDFSPPVKKGDISGDNQVNLADVISALQVLSGLKPAQIRCDYGTSGADVNGDGRVGLHDLIYVLQKVAGLRG